MAQNEQVYAICCRLEVASDVISVENVKTIEGYAVLNFEVASFSIVSQILKKKNFMTTAASVNLVSSYAVDCLVGQPVP